MNKFFKNFMTISGATMLSRLLGFVRDAMMAQLFGSGLVVDAFIIAFKLPNLFRSLFAEGAFATAFVPIYNKIRAIDKVKSMQFASNILAWLAVILALVTVLALIFMDGLINIIAVGFRADEYKFALSVEWGRITIPYLFCICLASLLSALLNSQNKFIYGAIAPVILNLVMILFMLLSMLGVLPLSGAVLAWGVFSAGLCQLGFMIYGCYAQKIKFVAPKLKEAGQERTFLKKLAPSVVGSGVVQVNSVMSDTIASLVGTGAVSYLFYADRLVQLPLALLGIALGTLILQELSKNFANNDRESAQKNLNKALLLAILIAVPAAIGLGFLAEPIIKILFERGAFTHQNTLDVAYALHFFAAALPFWVMSKILTPIFYAMGDTKTSLKIAALVVVVNGSLAFWFKDYLGHGGIALASMLSAVLNNVCLVYQLKKRGLWLVSASVIKPILMILMKQIPIILILAAWALSAQQMKAWQLGMTIILIICYYGAVNWRIGMTIAKRADREKP